MVFLFFSIVIPFAIEFAVKVKGYFIKIKLQVLSKVKFVYSFCKKTIYYS